MENNNYAIIFDTNSLLDLYQKEGIYYFLIPHFKNIENNIIIPNQVYEEYTYNLKHLKLYESNKYENAINLIKNIHIKLNKNNQLKNQINKIVGNDILINDLILKIKNVCEEAESKIKELKTKKEDNEDTLLKKDLLENLINRRIQNQNIKKITITEFIEIFKKAEERIRYNIPPGITDAKKATDNSFEGFKNKFGDFIIWKEILEYAKNNPDKDIYLIQNEKKVDWLQEKNGKELATILKNEFKEYSKKNILTLNLEDFFRKFKENLQLPEAELKALEKYIISLNSKIDSMSQNLENEILEMVQSNGYNNIYKYLDNNLFNLIEKNGNTSIISNDITGDRFDYIDELEVSLLNNENCSLDKNGLNNIIVHAKIETECTLRFYSTGGRDIGFSKNVDIIGNLFLKVNLFNFNVNSEEFEGNSFDIEKFEFLEIDSKDTELEIYADYNHDYDYDFNH